MSADRLIGSRITRRRFTAMSLAVPAVTALPIGWRGVSAQDAVVATMVTDTNGLGDQNFNDLANKGGSDAAADFGITWKVIESADAAAYVPNLIAGAEQGQLTVGVGFFLTDAITEVANQFPDKSFLLIDTVSDAPNVRSVTFKEQEPAYLVGIVAGKMTKTNKIGVVGGQDIPPVERYEVGFVAGVRSVNPAAEISIAYADTFSDPAKGKELAQAQYEQGADIVLPIAGLTGVGGYQAVKERNKPGQEWILGADVSQDHLAPGFELAVSRKGVDFAVYQGCKDVAEGSFTPGTINYDLKSGGVGLETFADRVPAEVVGLANGYAKLIVDGTLVIPSTREELETFTPPAEPAPIMASPAAGA